MGFLNLLPKEEQYFDLFIQMTVYIGDAARELKQMLADKPENYQEYSQRIKRLEHACDELTHAVTTKLNKSFITPFDREDIYTLSVALDDVCDYMDAAARAVVMYNIHESDPTATQLAVIIQKLCHEIHAAIQMLEHSK